MKLIHKEIKLNDETFTPELHLHIAIEISLKDKNMTDDELYHFIGKKFVDMFKEKYNPFDTE
jgi:hypothetical protein